MTKYTCYKTEYGNNREVLCRYKYDEVTFNRSDQLLSERYFDQDGKVVQMVRK